MIHVGNKSSLFQRFVKNLVVLTFCSCVIAGIVAFFDDPLSNKVFWVLEVVFGIMLLVHCTLDYREVVHSESRARLAFQFRKFLDSIVCDFDLDSENVSAVKESLCAEQASDETKSILTAGRVQMKYFISALNLAATVGLSSKSIHMILLEVLASYKKDNTLIGHTLGISFEESGAFLLAVHVTLDGKPLEVH